jgi:adenosylcobinamide-GDP ribazoletransferase
MPKGLARLLGAGLQQLRLFFIALQFFTRIPIPRWVGFEAVWLQHAARYFPLMGVVIALVSGTTYSLAAMVLPSPVAVLLATIAGIYLTGAFHEDGFADVCDGLGGGYTTERVLEIMKDSRVGAYGAIGIGLMLGLKCLLLSELPSHSVFAALLLAHPFSRLAATSLIWRLKYVRVQDSKAKPIAEQMNGREFVIASVTTLLPIILLAYQGWLGWQSIAIALACGTLAAAWMAHKLVSRIGGYTGDGLGAVQQLSEVAIYIGLLASLNIVTGG